MSVLVVAPELLASAAADLDSLGSTLTAANAAAAVPTTGLAAAGADEVSAALATLFGGLGQDYQVISAQVSVFHQQFVQALSSGAGSYLAAEAANASPLGRFIGARRDTGCDQCTHRAVVRTWIRLSAPEQTGRPRLRMAGTVACYGVTAAMVIPRPRRE